MTLSSEAGGAFNPGSDIESVAPSDLLQKIDNTLTLPEMRQLTAGVYVTAQNNESLALKGRDLQHACHEVFEWHMTRLKELSATTSETRDRSLPSAEAILLSLNRALSNIGCKPVRDEGTKGPHEHQKRWVRDQLVNLTVNDIKATSSPGIMEMALKEFGKAMRQVGLETGEDAAETIYKALGQKADEQKTALKNDPARSQMWKDWGELAARVIPIWVGCKPSQTGPAPTL